LHNTYLDLGEVLRKIEEEKERRRAWGRREKGEKFSNFNPRERKKREKWDILATLQNKYPLVWNYHYALAFKRVKSDSDIYYVMSWHHIINIFH
jgi:hypothetical protein